MNVYSLIFLLIIFSLFGCASQGAVNGPGSGYGASYEPVVDYYNIDRDAYRSDLYECQSLASEFKNNSSSGATRALAGAIAGAAVGAAFGNKKTAKKLAAVGGISSYASGSISSSKSAKDAVIRCLKGRGYKVLK